VTPGLALFARTYLIGIAVAGRLAWELLRPVLPVVIVLLAVVAVLSLLVRRLKSW